MNKRADDADMTAESVEPKRENLRRQSKKAVIINLVVLFVVVVFFIVLSYLMQNKTNSRMNKLYSENSSAQQHIASLLEQNEDLTSQRDELIAEADTLNEEIKELKSDLEDAYKLWTEDLVRVTLAGDEKYNELLKEYEALLIQIEETEENEDA